AYAAREVVRLGDGRLYDGVLEHRGAEFHVGSMPKVQDAGGAGTGRRGRRIATSLAEINVVPLVDVMLVLLIIFMITAPMIQRGVDVKLPVSTRTTQISGERVFVTIPISYRKNRFVSVGNGTIDEPVLADVLPER